MSASNREPSRPKPGEVIRITVEEATSKHVDDLLQRQASLQGEKGITADRRRAWYYSNWFIFSITGCLCAMLAWLILEPIFADTLYVRATLSLPDEEPLAREDSILGAFGTLVQLKTKDRENGGITPALIVPDTILVGADGKISRGLMEEDLPENKEVGVHLESAEGKLIVIGIDAVPGPSAYQSLESANKVNATSSLVFFAIVSALVGLGIGSVDGLMCRVLTRALLCGSAGMLIGFIGGFASGILADIVYGVISSVAKTMSDENGELTTFGFLTQLAGRSVGWALAGLTMGLGQGLVLRSQRLLLYGFLGGLIGGLIGGLVFDPIQVFLVPKTSFSGHWARLAGLCVVGTCVGLMIGLVELLARDAWLHMVRGPLAGKEFLIFKDSVRVGASPSSDIYLFNDDDVMDHHAVIRAVADNYEIESIEDSLVDVNGRQVNRTKLRSGDQITLGKTVFVFQRKRVG